MAINTRDFAIPKPGDRDELLKLSPKKYTAYKREVWEKQKHCCGKCHGYIGDPDDSHLHHTEGRGMAGSKRDDRKTIILCPGCHAKEH